MSDEERTEEVERDAPDEQAPPQAPTASRPRVRPGRGQSSRWITRALLGLTAVGLVVCVVSIGGVAYLINKSDSGDVAEGSFLKIRLGPSMSDAPKQGGLFSEPGEEPPVVSELAAALRDAATDERIAGVYLKMDSPKYGWANTQELRDALLAFREQGKPCVVYSEGFSNLDYYLASVCNEVVLAPAGSMLTAGLAIDVTYYANTFEKLGVTPQFEHVGAFKSGPEPYTSTGPSPAASEAFEALLDSLFPQLVRGVAAGRSLSEDDVRNFIDHPALAPKEAMERGLIDAVAFPDAVERHLLDDSLRKGDEATWVASLGETLDKTSDPTDNDDDDVDDERFTSLKEYLKYYRQEQAGFEQQIAVVHAEGTIVSGDPDGGMFGDEGSLADRPFARWMKAVREDEDVKAVVLRVNSPGGSGLASDMMWREVQRTRAAGKPVVVSMSNYAASGGYYISAPADYIVAEPGTLTGSIGVFGGKFSLEGTYDKIGLNTHRYQRGQNADLWSPTPFSDEGRTIFKSYLQNFYDTFLQRVSDGRGMPVEGVHEVAQGRVWTGEQALERGLVDQLGGLDVAVAKAAELGGVTEAYGVSRFPRHKPFFEKLVEDLTKASSPTVSVAPIAAELGVDVGALRDLALLEQLSDGKNAIALLPGTPAVQ